MSLYFTFSAYNNRRDLEVLDVLPAVPWMKIIWIFSFRSEEFPGL